MNTALPSVHKHVFSRLKEVMRVSILGEAGKLSREEVFLSRTRQEFKGSTGGPKEIYESPKIIQTVHVAGGFSPRNLVLAFIRSSKGSMIQRIRNNWATG